MQSIIDQFELVPHPEGGFYKEAYRSEGIISSKSLNGQFSGDRNYCTSIYFLLTSDNFSAFHRIKQDEIWHFYEGSPLFVHVIDEYGTYQKYELGADYKNGQVRQLVVPANLWFASSVKDEKSHSFVGCTVAPGFDFEDFEMADRNELIEEFPSFKNEITSLTRM
jgi:predicted cupin superfamily sugar epimerase